MQMNNGLPITGERQQMLGQQQAAQRKAETTKQANSEEEQDKMRVNELYLQNEENNEEIMRNKEEINGLKVQIMTVLKQQQAEMMQNQGLNQLHNMAQSEDLGSQQDDQQL